MILRIRGYTLLTCLLRTRINGSSSLSVYAEPPETGSTRSRGVEE
jgi:hypothetical protein